MRTFKALDLFCGAGGVTRGLQQAGFHVTGVDIKPQKNYVGDVFVEADAMNYPLGGFDLIWASPPCQRYSKQSNCRSGLARDYPDLINGVRARLINQPLNYVIENVIGAPLTSPIMLCGLMFDLELYRHRLFESSCLLIPPAHPAHSIPASKSGHWREGTIMSVAGHIAPVSKARKVMDIDWTDRAELAEAIPPAYSEFIGKQVIQKL